MFIFGTTFKIWQINEIKNITVTIVCNIFLYVHHLSVALGKKLLPWYKTRSFPIMYYQISILFDPSESRISIPIKFSTWCLFLFWQTIFIIIVCITLKAENHFSRCPRFWPLIPSGALTVGSEAKEWKSTFQCTYMPNMNAFWWMNSEIWPFEKKRVYKT